jgi:hypothetical protein
MKNRKISEILPTHTGYRHWATALVHAKTTGTVAVEAKWPKISDSMKSVQGLQDRCQQQDIPPESTEIRNQEAAHGSYEHNEDQMMRMRWHAAFRQANRR